jgi:cation:H+ antiporter
VITRLEGWILMGLYGLYVIEQILSSSASSVADEFRLFVLVAAVPALMVFLIWSVLRWRQQRRLA